MCSQSTELLIEQFRVQRRSQSIVLNPRYLDDEKLPGNERSRVLQTIFNRNIRERQLQRIIRHLAPILDGIHPSSALIYGPTGSGKTVTLMHVLDSFASVAAKNNQAFDYSYIDLTSPKSFFGALNETAIALDPETRRYRKGVPIEQMQERIIKSLKLKPGYHCFLIDEADNIRPNVDQFLTFLAKTLPRKVHCRVILILLTNRLDWEKSLDPRIISFLKKTDIIFEPYDAMDLLEILNLRVEKALDASKVDEAAIKKIAAVAARENGDARKAIEILAKSVRIAEETSGRLTNREVDLAEEHLEQDKSEALIRALAQHQRLALKACYLTMQTNKLSKIYTGDAYQAYRKVCATCGVRPLTQRRFSDAISFLDLYGLINARIIFKGRYGNTREISGSLAPQVVARFLRTVE